MKLKTKDICIKVLTDDEELQLQTYTYEYRNLMMLLFDKIYLEDFGECKGMGRCGTCMIEIIAIENKLSDFGRNERETMKKAGAANSNKRLACQILVTNELHNATIRITAQD